MSAAAGATETGQLMWPDLRGDGFISSGINQLIWGVLEMGVRPNHRFQYNNGLNLDDLGVPPF